MHIDTLRAHLGEAFENEGAWQAFLASVHIKGEQHVRVATEGALLGSVLTHGFCNDLVIVSDDAGQFDVLQHALCWIHAERLVHKTLPLSEAHREDIAKVRGQIWALYADLKAFKNDPRAGDKIGLAQRFDEIFTQKTRFETLNQLLKRLRRNKDDLLRVLERPEIPLHTNGSETDIRDYVKKRKVSGGTRSDEGQRCRDTFISCEEDLSKAGHLVLGLSARPTVFAGALHSLDVRAGARTRRRPGLLRSYWSTASRACDRTGRFRGGLSRTSRPIRSTEN